jgi:hypothetical protein
MISSKGKCFYNSDKEETTSNRICTDILDINNCNELKSINLCTYANKTMYPNIYGISSVSFICNWNAKKDICETINDNTGDIGGNNEKDNGSNNPVIIIVIIIIVLVVSLLIVIIIIVIIIVRRKRKMLKTRITDELQNIKTEELETLKRSGISSSRRGG